MTQFDVDPAQLHGHARNVGDVADQLSAIGGQLPSGLAEYHRSLKACVLDERFIADSTTSVERIASTIIHEATHARLEQWGITYKEELRARIEVICLRRELAFAVRLPDCSQLQEDRAQDLNWYQANPDYFHDAHFIERHTKGEVEVLRHIGVPDWLIRADRHVAR